MTTLKGGNDKMNLKWEVLNSEKVEALEKVADDIFEFSTWVRSFEQLIELSKEGDIVLFNTRDDLAKFVYFDSKSSMKNQLKEIFDMDTEQLAVELKEKPEAVDVLDVFIMNDDRIIHAKNGTYIFCYEEFK